LPHATTMQLFKKSNMVDYICMHDMYKLPYRKPIFNSLGTIIQLTDFLTLQFIYYYTIFLKDNCIVFVIHKG